MTRKNNQINYSSALPVPLMNKIQILAHIRSNKEGEKENKKMERCVPNPKCQTPIEFSVKLKPHSSFISRSMKQTKLKNERHDIYWLRYLISSAQLSAFTHCMGFLFSWLSVLWFSMFFCHNLQDILHLEFDIILQPFLFLFSFSSSFFSISIHRLIPFRFEWSSNCCFGSFSI